MALTDRQAWDRAWEGTLAESNLPDRFRPGVPHPGTPNQIHFDASVCYAASTRARNKALGALRAERPWWRWREGFTHFNEERSTQYWQGHLVQTALIHRVALERGDEEVASVSLAYIRQSAALAALTIVGPRYLGTGARNKDRDAGGVTCSRHMAASLRAMVGLPTPGGLSPTPGYSGWLHFADEYRRGVRYFTEEEAKLLVPGGAAALPLVEAVSGGWRQAQPMTWWAYADGTWCIVWHPPVPEPHDSPIPVALGRTDGSFTVGGPPGYWPDTLPEIDEGGPFKPTRRGTGIPGRTKPSVEIQVSRDRVRWSVRGHPWHNPEQLKTWEGVVGLPSPKPIAGLAMREDGLHRLSGAEVDRWLQSRGADTPTGRLIPPPEGATLPSPPPLPPDKEEPMDEWKVLPKKITAEDIEREPGAARLMILAAYALLDQWRAGIDAGGLNLTRLRRAAERHQGVLSRGKEGS